MAQRYARADYAPHIRADFRGRRHHEPGAFAAGGAAGRPGQLMSHVAQLATTTTLPQRASLAAARARDRFPTCPKAVGQHHRAGAECRVGFVGAALASVRDQPVADIEVLVVDAGSSDGTVDLVAEIVAADPASGWSGTAGA